MIIFSSKKLEKALAENKITNWQKAKYVIIPGVLFSPFVYSASLISPRYKEALPGRYMLIKLFLMITSMIIIYLGIKTCFKMNGKIDGQKFLERFCVLALPAFLQTYIYFFFFSLIGIGILFSVVKPPILTTHKIALTISAIGSLFPLMYYWLLYRSFRRFGSLLIKEGGSKVDSHLHS